MPGLQRQAEKECIYCGVKNNLKSECVVPKTLKIIKECANCDKLHGVHNRVLACKDCVSIKGGLGLYEFYKKMNANERKFYDIIPPLLERKYLKIVYFCHKCAGTLNRGDLNGDGKLTAMDLDEVVK